MPTIDPFSGTAASSSGLAIDIIEVAPADADLPTRLREIRVGTGANGTLRVTGPRGNVVNFLNVNAGDNFPGPFVRVHLTGTTVSNLVGWV